MKAKPKLFKRLGSFLVALIMSLTCLAGLNLSAFATSGDMGGQGHGTETADKQNKWMYTLQGVRLTALDATNGSVKSPSIDWAKTTNNGYPYNLSILDGDDIIHYGKVYKRSYTMESILDEQIGGYEYKSPPAGMPDIIIDGRSNINAIREFFVDEVIVKDFCVHVYGGNNESDFDSSTEAQALFNRFTSGELVLAIEPMAYFYYNGDPYACTATEAALLDKQLGSKIYKSKAGRLTNLMAPDALFLEERHEELDYPDLRPAYDANGKTFYKDDTIIDSCLGIGIVWFDPGDPTVHHHIYNVKLNVPKGSTLSYNGHDIPLSTANITKILKGSPVKDDKGASVTGGAELAKAMLNYCNQKGMDCNKRLSYSRLQTFKNFSIMIQRSLRQLRYYSFLAVLRKLKIFQENTLDLIHRI